MVKEKFIAKPFTVTIDRLHPDGYGVGEYNGAKIAVFGALPGEEVVATVIGKRRKKIYAQAKKVITPAKSRVPPFCSHTDICAGCCLQHCDTDTQLRYKQEFLLEQLDENQPTEILHPLTGPVQRYRSKARIGVKYVEKKNKVLVGFHERLSSFIAEIDTCKVLQQSIGTILTDIGAVLSQLQCGKRIPQIEIAVGEDFPALVFRHLDPLPEGDIEKLKTLAEHKSVHIYLQPGGPHTAHKIWPVSDEERLHYTIPDYEIEMAFHPLDFTQVNFQVNRDLVSQAVKLLDIECQDIVLDLFCGIGNFGLPFARAAARVLGVDGSASSIHRAEENARHNSIANATFHVTDLTKSDLFSGWFEDNFDKAVIDPPRSGALQVCRLLGNSKIRKVVYVSCNPTTLGRDSKILVDAGFNLRKAGVIDMFPHTGHVESITLFER